MKTRQSNPFRSHTSAVAALSVALLSHFSAPTAEAAGPYYWDVNGATAGFSTVVGAWNGTNAFWNTDASGGSGTLVAAPTAADDLFIKQATTNTGSLTVSGTQSAGSITFVANVGPTTLITGGAITLGGAVASPGIFEQSSGANTVSTPLTLNQAVSAFAFSNTGTGALTIGAITGTATTGNIQTITLASAAAGGITLNGLIGNGANSGKVALVINNTSTGTTTLTNSASNTFSGGVTLKAGTLSATATADGFNSLGGSAVLLGDTSGSANATLLLGSGRTVTYGNAITVQSGSSGNALLLQNGGNNTLSGALTLGTASSTGQNLSITTPTSVQAFTISGKIQDPSGLSGAAGNLTIGVAGGGKVTFSNATNNYTGSTTVVGGTLVPTVAATLPGYTTAGKVIFNGGIISVPVGGTGWTTAQVDTLLSNATKTSGALGIDTTSAGLSQWSAFTTGNFGSTLGLAKIGANTLTLDQTNTYNGPTTLIGGTLSVGTSANLGAAAANLVFGGGTLQITGTTLTNFSGIGHTVSFNAGAGVGLDINSAANTFTLDQALNQTTGGFTKAGAGTVILNQVNTYSGATTISAGTLQIGGGGKLNSGTYAGAISIATGATLQYSGSVAQTLSGAITGLGGLTKDTNTIDLTLSGTNTYSGTTTVSAGRIAATTAANLSTGATSLVQSGSGQFMLGGVAFTNPFTISGTGYLEGSDSQNNRDGAIRMGGSTLSGTITLSGNSRIGAFNSTINTLSGKITGSYGIDFYGAEQTANGATVFVISNPANNYTGNTTIYNSDYNTTNLAGVSTTLKLGASNVIPDGASAGNVAFAVNGTNTLATDVLDLNGFSETINGLTVNAGTFAAKITNSGLGASILTIGANNTTSSFPGAIADGGAGKTLAIAKTGSGTLTLSGTSTYIADTLVSDGTLALSGAGAINGSSGITVNGGAAKFLQAGNVAVTPAVTLTQGTLTGSGSVSTVNVGAGTGGIVSNNNGVAGASLSIGALTFSGAATVNTFSSSTAAPIATTSLATNSAGTVTLNPSAPIWTSGQTYELISYGGGSIGVAGFGQFVLGTISGLTPRQTTTFADTGSAITLAIAGDLPFWTGGGDGKWNLSSTSNWLLVATPTTYLANDVVLFNDNAAGTGPVSVNIDAANVTPTATIFSNSSRNYVVTSSGGFGIASGSLTMNGTGTLTLSTANTYTGATNLNAGTLILSGSGTLGTASALTLGGGQLDLGGSSQSVGALVVTAAAATGDTLRNGSLSGSSYAASNSSGDAIVSANLLANGTAGFAMTGAGGTVTLAGANTYTGATSVSAGTVSLSGSLSGSNVTVSGSGALSETATGGIAGTGVTQE